MAITLQKDWSGYAGGTELQSIAGWSTGGGRS